MEYPGTKFTKPLRFWLLVCFILAFLIIAPLMILYSIGYRYDWQYGIAKKTGALSVDIYPKTGEVYLDNIKLKKNTLNKKVEVKNLIPGKYNLNIKTPGYNNWQKDIEIKAKQTVYIKEINLIRQNQPQLFIDEKVDYFSLSPDSRYIIYVSQTNQPTQLWLYDNDEQATSLLLKLTNAKSLTINWSYKHGCAVIASQDSNSGMTSLCFDKIPKLTTWPATGETIKKIQWRQSRQPELYYSTDKNIFSFMPATGQNRLITSNKFLDWHMEDNQLWTIQINTSTKNYVIIKDTLGFKEKFVEIKMMEEKIDTASTTRLNLIIAKNNNILLKKKDLSEMILLNKAGSEQLAGEKFLLSPYNEWWIIWTPWELWTYIEGQKPELQNRSGANLLQVIPLDEFNALGLVWQDKTTVLFPYYLVTHDLLNLKLKQAAADSKNRLLYFTREDKQGIWRLEY